NSIGSDACSTTEDAPHPRAGINNARALGNSNHAARLVGVRVVHGDVGGVCGALIYGREAAISPVGANPSPVRLQKFSAVILRAANRKIRIRRMNREAFKLGGVETSRVQACPG